MVLWFEVWFGLFFVWLVFVVVVLVFCFGGGGVFLFWFCLFVCLFSIGWKTLPSQDLSSMGSFFVDGYPT